MHRLIRWVTLFVPALGFAGVPADVTAGARFSQALAEVRAMVAAAPDAWGLSVSVTALDRMVLIATHGYADIERRVPVTADTRFAIGSISKSFAALVLLQMADDNRFDPAAPIERYLPELQLHSDFPPITGYSLLTHTSGLPDYLYQAASMRYAATALGEFHPRYAPGAHFWYSNLGYQLLGYAAEHIDAAPYALVLRRRMFERLQMRDTAPQIDARLRGRMASSYARAADGSIRQAPWFAYLAADGGIVSTASDMGHYMRMLLARGDTPHGRLLSVDGFARFATPVLEDYGCGIEVLAGGSVLAHSGSIAGFQAYVNADVGRGFGVMFLANGPIDKSLRDRIIARLTDAAGGKPRRFGKVEPPTPFAGPAAFAGRFSGDNGSALVFKAAGHDALILREPEPNEEGPEVAPLPLTRLARDIWGAYETERGPRAFVFFRDGSGAFAGVSEGAARYGSQSAPAPVPAEWRALTGRYMAHGEEGPGARIFARGSELMIAYTDSNAPPTTLRAGQQGHFRFAEPEWAPEELVFDTIVEGRAQRLLLSGTPMYRVELP